MTIRTSLFGGAALGALLALALTPAANAAAHHKKHHVAPPPVDDGLRSEVETLKAQVDALQAREDQEAAARQQTQEQVQALQGQLAQADARAERAEQQVQAQIETIPGAVSEQVAAKLPKPGNVKVTLGGFSALETVYRSRNDVADIGSNYSKIPYLSSTSAHEDELRFTARQSRISVLVQGDVDPDTHAAFYGEFDFLGAGQTANSNESNSYQPRIRHMYGTVDWDALGFHVLAGQTWSLVTMNGKGISPRSEIIPPTIEAQYVAGFVWARQPQLRFVKDFDDKQVWAAVSFENPQTTVATSAEGGTSLLATGVSANVNNAGISLLNNQVSYSENHYPDIVGKLAFEPLIGGAQPLHLEVFGLWRDYYDRVTYTSANTVGVAITGNCLSGGANATCKNIDTSGGGVGGGVTWTVVPHLLDVQGSVLTGKGLGRYGSGQLPDTLESANGSLQPIGETMWLVGGTLHATPTLDLYAFYGDERQNSTGVEKIGSQVFGYGYANAVLGAGCDIEGGSCATLDTQQIDQITGGLWDKVYTGKFGSVRVGLQYSHTDLTAFPGYTASNLLLATKPKTNDDMFFTSFRYYPGF
ncbi:MAG TPA: DNA-binding protein [Caulobacteraceae bacterium]|nr:DNA-binding protein [Caulobacteraceae bacterium]